MVRTLAPEAGFAVKLAVANEWLFEPLLIRQIGATPAGAASLHTTIAPTMLRGSPKENVLPQDAAAWINYRIAPWQTSAEVLDRARAATAGLGVTVDWERPPYEPSPVSSITSRSWQILSAVAASGGEWPVAPGLVTATTDSRSLTGVATDIYRFQAIVASLREFEMIHGTNEHLTLDNLGADDVLLHSPDRHDHAMIAARLRQSVLAATIVLAAACSPREESAPDRPVEPAVLRRGLGAEPDTLDPQHAEDNAALAVLGDLYEGLARSQSDGTAEFGAAESWDISSDGRTYVFKLRRDLRWSNGDALTAAHFAATLEMLTAPGSTAPQAGLYAAIEGVFAEDDRTLRVQLARPMPHLIELLALAAAAPRHPTAAPSAQAPAPPPGNGAFRLRERIVGEQISLERNPNYWDAARVALDAVVYRTITDLGTELNLYRTGELDVTSEVPNAHSAGCAPSVPPNCTSRRTWARTRMRSTSRACLIETRDARSPWRWIVNESRGRSRARASDRHTGGFRMESRHTRRRASRGRRFRTRRPCARRATAWDRASERGAAPKHLALCTDASANHHRTAVALADLWHSALGVDIEILEMEWKVYLDRAARPATATCCGSAGQRTSSIPAAFAGVFESGHPQNTLGYRSPRYDSLLERSRTAPTPGSA